MCKKKIRDGVPWFFILFVVTAESKKTNKKRLRVHLAARVEAANFNAPHVDICEHVAAVTGLMETGGSILRASASTLTICCMETNDDRRCISVETSYAPLVTDAHCP